MALYKDCARCSHLMKDGNCRGTADYWPMREIWLCRFQCLFLISELLPLPGGSYPKDTYTSGYTEAPRTSFRIGAKAPYESALQLRGELTKRLSMAGTDGEWLVSDVQKGVPLEQLPYKPRCALHYVSGWYRKRLSYTRWKWEQEHRRKPHWIIV